MQFTLPCATFLRIARASLLHDELTDRKDVEAFRSVRLEHHNGKSLILATRKDILAVEFLGNSIETSNSFVHIANDPELLADIETASRLDETMTLTVAPGWTVMQFSSGRVVPRNVAVEGCDYPKPWRLMFAREPERNKHPFAFHADLLARLGSTSPNGTFVLPKTIDITAPVILNDAYDPDWMGIIGFPTDDDGVQLEAKPAVIRDWLGVPRE